MVLEKAFEKIYFLMKLSMMYLLLVICGLFVFGISPANAAMMSLHAQHKGKVENYHFSEAFSLFKASFLQANLYFFSLSVVGAGLAYGLYILTQLVPSIWLLLVLVVHLLALLYLLCFYAIYLKLQVYFEFSYWTGVKLAAMAVFFDWKAIVKWLLGSAICALLAVKIPLIVFVFVPIIWLIFTFDVLHPIYEEVEKSEEPQ